VTRRAYPTRLDPGSGVGGEPISKSAQIVRPRVFTLRPLVTQKCVTWARQITTNRYIPRVVLRIGNDRRDKTISQGIGNTCERSPRRRD
jgi:hypothetical protein